jgi:hypothetical protein
MEFRILKLNGFDGEITIDDTDDFTVSTSQRDERIIEGRLSMSKDDWRGVRCLQLTASAHMPDGTKKTVRVTPTDPAEQAFAYTHLVPQPGFFFCAPLAKEPEIVKDLTMKKKGADHANGQACSKCHQDGRK